MFFAPGNGGGAGAPFLPVFYGSASLYSDTLYLVYLCRYLGLDLFMSNLCNLFFIFTLIFVVINHITSSKQTYLFFFVIFLEYLLLFLDNNVDEKSRYFSNSKSYPQGVAYLSLDFFTNFSQTLLIKMLFIKKSL